MTIDQQLRDRFDRETSAGVPEPDLAAVIAAGRRRRRGRGAAYAVGALAVAAVAATAVVVPRLGADPLPTLADPPADDGTFVPGTTIDTDLAAAVAAADPSLPAPRDVYPSDWSRDTPLPGRRLRQRDRVAAGLRPVPRGRAARLRDQARPR